MTDHELLQDYAQRRSERAFATLVERHLALVYSAARRQVHSSHLAEEVTQSVFLDLSRQAASLPASQPLVAWLHVVTRRTAIDTVRREARRRAREEAAAALHAAEVEASLVMKTTSDGWAEVEPLLDEAVETLPPADRAALLLRFFENKSLRDIGATLGISDDAAQKRLSRALDRLRAFYAGRGIAVGSAAFAATLSAHAVQAVPAGLAATISTSAAALPSATVALAHHLAMTTAQKTFATVALAAALGFALYEAIPAFRLHAQMRDGQQQINALAATERQLTLEQTTAARELSRLTPSRVGAQPTAEPGSDAALAQEAAAWTARITRLKQTFAQRPELAIPELTFLTERDWILAASGGDFSREADILQSLRLLRTLAKSNLLNRLADATRQYFGSTHTPPDQWGHLAPLLGPATNAAVFARYDFQIDGTRLVIAEKLSGAVDPDRLALFTFEDTKTKRGLSMSTGTETAEQRSAREAAQASARAARSAPAGPTPTP